MLRAARTHDAPAGTGVSFRSLGPTKASVGSTALLNMLITNHDVLPVYAHQCYSAEPALARVYFQVGSLPVHAVRCFCMWTSASTRRALWQEGAAEGSQYWSEHIFLPLKILVHFVATLLSGVQVLTEAYVDNVDMPQHQLLSLILCKIGDPNKVSQPGANLS